MLTKFYGATQGINSIQWLNMFNSSLQVFVFVTNIVLLNHINPLCAKFFRGNINIYLHFVLFLHIDATQEVEIFPHIRQEPTYST